jgi:hypothetical protein
MKKIGTLTVFALGVSLVLNSMVIAGGRPAASASSGVCTAVSALPYQEPDDAEKADLLYMREEEKLAHDVYLALYNKWKHRAFNTIARSEQQHTDAIKSLLDKYGLEDPAVSTPGIFSNEELQSLYDELVAAGSVSLIEALRAGATIEDLDIYDLNDAVSAADNSDIKTVYRNLTKGSENHLKTFVSQLARYGQTYEAQYLSEEEIEYIVGSVR